MNTPDPRWHHGLLLGQTLGIALLLISFARIGGEAVQSMMFRNDFFAVMLDGPVWGTTLGNSILHFGLAVLLVHLVFGTVCWALGHLSARAWPSATTTLRQHVLLCGHAARLAAQHPGEFRHRPQQPVGRGTFMFPERQPAPRARQALDPGGDGLELAQPTVGDPAADEEAQEPAAEHRPGTDQPEGRKGVAPVRACIENREVVAQNRRADVRAD